MLDTAKSFILRKLSSCFNNPFRSSFFEGKAKAGIIAFGIIVAVYLFISLIMKGFAWTMSLSLPIVALFVLVFLCGQLFQFLGAILFVILINQVGTGACDFIGIFVENVKVDQARMFLVEFGYYKSTLIVFFFLSTVRMVTSSFKIFSFNISNSSSSKQEGGSL